MIELYRNKKVLKLYLFIILLFMCFNLVGCNFKKENNDNVASTINNFEKDLEKDSEENIYKYEEYEELYTYLLENMDIEDYLITTIVYDNFVVAIDKEWSFGTRTYMNMDNELYSPKPIQKTITFENKNGISQFLLAVCYRENYIGEDMIFCGDNTLENTYSDISIICYKNILFSINVLTNENNIDEKNEKNSDYAKALNSLIENIEKFEGDKNE